MPRWYRIFIDEPRQLPWYLKFLDYRFITAFALIAGVMWAGNWIFNPKTVTAEPEVPQTSVAVVATTTTTTAPTTTTAEPTTTTTTTETPTTTTATTTTVVYKDGEPGSCLILEEKYCSTGVVIGELMGGKLIAFNLPAKTPVFAGLSGEAGWGTLTIDSEGIPYPSVRVGINGRNVRTFFYYAEEQILHNVEKGEVIGYLGLKLLPSPTILIKDGGEYNLVIQLDAITIPFGDGD